MHIKNKYATIAANTSVIIEHNYMEPKLTQAIEQARRLGQENNLTVRQQQLLNEFAVAHASTTQILEEGSDAVFAPLNQIQDELSAIGVPGDILDKWIDATYTEE